MSTQAYWALTQAYWALTRLLLDFYWALTPAYWTLTGLLPRHTGLFYPSLCVIKSHYVQLLSVHFSQDANDAFSEWFQHIHSRRPVSHSQTHSARGEGLPLSLVLRPTLPGERVCHSVLFPDPLCQGRESATQSCSQTHSARGEGLPLSLVPRPTLPGERVCHSVLFPDPLCQGRGSATQSCSQTHSARGEGLPLITHCHYHTISLETKSYYC